MEGMLPESPDVLKAMSPDFAQVLNVRTTGDGRLYKGTLAADEAGFQALIRATLKRANGHLQAIRSGQCAAAPARSSGANPCTYCDYRALCLFDDRLDAARVRKFPSMTNEEAMEKMKLED